MAQTNAEKQALLRTRRKQSADELVTQNNMLMIENTKLQETVKLLTEKIHAMELASLKAQLRAAKKA